MKKSSVKKRITLYIVALMTVLYMILAFCVLSLSHRIVHKSIVNHMEQLLRLDLDSIGFEGKQLSLKSEFLFSRDGVNILILKKDGALMAGQIPASFTETVPLENGGIREIDGGRARYVVMDVYYPINWEDGVWLRAIHEAPDYLESARGLLIISIIGLPIFLAMAGLGSYMIIQKSLKPLDTIADTASGINRAKDLSQRIGPVGNGDEFSRLGEVFDGLLERLEVLFESEKNFAGDASHELRTPITVIKGACDYSLKYDETKEEFTETVTTIRRQSDKMKDIVEQLLRITRLENGLEEGDFQLVDLGLLIRESISEGAFDESRIHMDIPEGIMARVEPLLIMRLSDNLLTNAFRYGAQNAGKVWLHLGCQGDEILYSVRDNGPGIEPENLSRIWQRFYRLDKNAGTEGTGLGLAFVWQISKAHGGRMEVQSKVGKGTTFTLHLPKV